MKSFRLENRTRSKLRLCALRPGQNKGDPLERDPENDIVLGDAQDTDEFLESKGVTERSGRCPSPVVVVTEAQIQRLAPSSRAALDAWRAGPKPTIAMTEIAA